MNDSFLNAGSLPLNLEHQVDALCDEFEEALKRGIVPTADEYLARIDESAHARLLSEIANLLRDYKVLDQQSLRVSSPGADSSAATQDSGRAGLGEIIEWHDANTRLHVPKSLQLLRELGEVGAKFEQALERGELLSIEEVVAAAKPELRPIVLPELLKIEMEFRSRQGENPSLEEFRRRFPEHGRLVKYLYFENYIPPRIGEFSIRRLLGRGGFGHVYQGWDVKLSRNVAIKVFRRSPDAPSAPGRGLLFEARMAAQLHHPGIVAVYAVLPDSDGDEFIVLEYVDGKSLEDLLRSRRLGAEESAALILDVVQALQHSHQIGLIHRDLKPANILLEHGRVPRVTDFGLAMHLTDLRRSPDVAGTLPYMAPEQAGGETHRLDARTDLWAVGVMLYRMLTGQMPFSGRGRRELLHAIRYADPALSLEGDPSIPAELARMVRRCLAKRMSDRYQTAAELADDLNAFLNPLAAGHANEPVHDRLPATSAVVPKGLRCFDASDREFFLQLVPGPRDRHGVPEEVRFWEQHLRELDSNQTFRVGLLYGPSGSGKSSLVHAGILPRLLGNIRVAVIQATRDETEARLARELRRNLAELSPESLLAETLGELREGALLPEGEKLVLIIDQFEQWLHGWQHDVPTPLVDLLRQCDGGRVQALLLVRDDFWMPATRFFQQLDVPLIAGFNAAAVDLFDATHAGKVLAAFGVAYGRLDADASRRSTEQERFLKRAVDELLDDGRIVPIRLAIFAEMVKTRPWNSATLRDVGGMQGLGTAFLEEVFDGRLASPIHRLHRSAARLVLERLLPPPGTDIRGHLVGESELQAVCGYSQQPVQFAALLRCLDQELRLITPSEIESAKSHYESSDSQHASPPRFYQLTHDFLVTAIRGWLNQARRRTLRGRAELRLAEYSGAFAARQESRQLPSWWEWLSILLFTRRQRWQNRERTVMRAATSRYALRGGAIVTVAIVAGALIYDRMAAIHADGLVQALTTSDSRDVPGVVERIGKYRGWTKSRLAEQLADQPQVSDQRIRLLLGTVAVGEPNGDELFDRLLEVDPPMAVAIADVMAHYGQLGNFESRLWEVAADPQAAPSRRLRACMALAKMSPVHAENWPSIATSAAAMLLRDGSENPRHFNIWVDALLPVRHQFIEPIRESFANPQISNVERLLAADILARYVVDDVPQLVELTLQAMPKQFGSFARILPKHDSAVRTALVREASRSIPADLSEDEKDFIARRQANAICLLRDIGEDKYLWPVLRYQPDPRLRSFLVQHFRDVSESPADWVRRLAREQDSGIRQAIVLVVGSADRIGASTQDGADLIESLLGVFRDDVDGGVHSAAEWTLRRLGSDAAIDAAIAQLSKLGIRPGYRWYVTKSKITMMIFGAPGPTVLGSSESEPGRDASDETVWTCNVDWSFAVSATEITQAQFLAVEPGSRQYPNASGPTLNCPANGINWLDAVRFCRLLSQKDEVPEGEMVIPDIDQLESEHYQDFRQHSGFRLPIEAEWETACRAGTVTPRFFGYAPDLLPYYCCYTDNSSGKSWRVGTGMPNAAGLFDVLGNVSEWCFDEYIAHPELQPDVATRRTGYMTQIRYGLRGNEWAANPKVLRAANRRFARPDESGLSRGFRIAHTVRE